MDLSEHLAISAAGSAAIALGGGGWEAALAFSVAGVLIDVDHLPDYWRETGLNLRLKEFFEYFPAGKPRKLFLLFHAWEWCLVALAASLWLGLPSWCVWGALGWLCHLLLDQRFNGMMPLTYSFFFRARHGFEARRFYGD